MKHLLRVLAAAMLLLLVVGPVWALGKIVIKDETGKLTKATIENAAKPLLARDAEIAIYMINGTGSSADFENRLKADGFINSSGSSVRAKLIGIYVGNQYSSIRYGDAWNAVLDTEQNYETIRKNNLNAELAKGNFSQAFAAALTAIEASVVNPPGQSVVNVSTVPIAVGGVGVVGVAAGYVLVRRRRSAQKLLTDANERATQAKQDAGGLIAELAQLFKANDDKAQYDKVTYAASDVQALARMQSDLKQRFVTVQTTFDDIGEKQIVRGKETVEYYDGMTQEYTGVKEQASAVRAEMTKLAAKRTELDKLAQGAREEVSRAKKS